MTRTRAKTPSGSVTDMLGEAVDGIIGGNRADIETSWEPALIHSRVLLAQYHPSHSFFYLAAVNGALYDLPRGIYFGWKPRFAVDRLHALPGR